MNARWRELTLGEFVRLQRGHDLTATEQRPGLVPVMGSAGPNGTHAEAKANGPGVVIGRSGASMGRVHYCAENFWPHNTCLYVTDFLGNDPLFVYYKLAELGLSRYNSGSAQPSLNRNYIYGMKLSVPDPLIQHQIAQTIRGFDRKIDLNRRINQTLETIAQTLFKSWFVDFDPVKAKIAAKQEGRDPLRAAMSAIGGKQDFELDTLSREQFDQLATTAALFPDEMEELELAEIPEGWSVWKVESLLARLSAKTRYTKEQVSLYGQIPVFEQGASILMGYHEGTATYQASADDPMFIFGDHTCVTRLSCQPFDVSQNVIPLQGRDRATTWVYYAVKEKQKFQEYRRHWMELVSKDVVVAAADVCLDFSQKVSNLHLLLEENERQMQVLLELRDTLLPKLMSGELSLAEALVEDGA